MASRSSDSPPPVADRPSNDEPPPAKRPSRKSPKTTDAGKGVAKRRKRPSKEPLLPDYAHETALLAQGLRWIAGVDEAGRGPLAGPVVAAAVVIDTARGVPAGLNDSKKLSAPAREEIFREIVALCEIGVASASAAEIDRHNIRGATLIAMRRALAALSSPPCHAIVDGRDIPPGLTIPASAIIAGDAASLSIAAASIVAKVTRDRMMQRACQRFPGYGFSQHQGYGTAAHLAALTRLGPSPLHRMTFRPLRRDLFAADE